MEHDELLPAEPDPGGPADGHAQHHLLLYLHEGQVLQAGVVEGSVEKYMLNSFSTVNL